MTTQEMCDAIDREADHWREVRDKADDRIKELKVISLALLKQATREAVERQAAAS